MPTLKEIINDLKENFETVEDIILTYQNDIYRQSSDDFDDLKKFLADLKNNIKELESKEQLLSKNNENNKLKTFSYKNGQSISVPSKSQWKQKSYYNNRQNQDDTNRKQERQG